MENAPLITVREEAAEGIVRVCVSDGEVGGADSARGSGLVGLKTALKRLARVIPVDVTQLVFLAMGPARPKLKDRRTGEVATDQQGWAITVVRVACVPIDESSEDDGDMDLTQTQRRSGRCV